MDQLRMETRLTTRFTSRITSTAVGLALLAAVPAACSSGGSSSKEIRARTKSVLVKGGMSKKEADCYVASLSDQTLEQIVKGGPSAVKDPNSVRQATKCAPSGN
ncbi:MAG: hypothetical protein M3070_03530 [Actinomycetota bacterium]|nr:hypothetical protein [Actinomycetota bacterium]